MVQYFETLNL